MKTLIRSLAMAGCAIGVSATVVSAQQLYHEDFEQDSTSEWQVNAFTTGEHPVDFFFDYSTVGIPAAPNSAGTTVGLKLQANTSTAAPTFGGVSVSPVGQSFLGDFTLRFDMWINYVGPFANADSTTVYTHATGAGIGTAGTAAQWAGGVPDSIYFAVTGDGGSSADYRAYSPDAGVGYVEASGVFAAGTGAGVRNNTHAYYSGFGGESAPAAQLALFPQQTGITPTGTVGLGWRDVEIVKQGNLVSYVIDGLLIATVDASTITLGGNNILLNYFDVNATVDDPALMFGLIDNVSVTVVPEPSSLALGLLGGFGLLLRRRK